MFYPQTGNCTVRYEHVPCNLCGQPPSRRLATVEASPEPYRIVYCALCDLYFVDPMPLLGAPETDALNSEMWYPGCTRDLAFDETDFRLHQEVILRQVADLERHVALSALRISDCGPLNDGVVPSLRGANGVSCASAPKVVDVGCGTGYFLWAAKERGWKAHGVDVSRSACAYVTTHFSVATHVGELTQVALPGGEFAAARLSHVLEHVVNPRALLDEVKRLLHPDGVAYVAVPHARSLVNRVRNVYHTLTFRRGRKYSADVHSPVHLWGFTRRSLATALTQTGFRVLELFAVAQGHPLYHPCVKPVQRGLKERGERWVDRRAEVLGMGSILVAYARRGFD